MDCVELLGSLERKTTAAVACQVDPERATEHAFIRSHPLDAKRMRDCEHLLGNAALRRPDTLRRNAKDLLVQIESSLELLASIFGMSETILWQRQSWSRSRALVGVANQG